MADISQQGAPYESISIVQEIEGQSVETTHALRAISLTGAAANVGNATTPVYFADGVPVQCEFSGSGGGSGTGGSSVSITPILKTGRKIAAYSIDGNADYLFAPASASVKYVRQSLWKGSLVNENDSGVLNSPISNFPFLFIHYAPSDNLTDERIQMVDALNLNNNTSRGTAFTTINYLDNVFTKIRFTSSVNVSVSESRAIPLTVENDEVTSWLSCVITQIEGISFGVSGDDVEEGLNVKKKLYGASAQAVGNTGSLSESFNDYNFLYMYCISSEEGKSYEKYLTILDTNTLLEALNADGVAYFTCYIKDDFYIRGRFYTDKDFIITEVSPSEEHNCILKQIDGLCMGATVSGGGGSGDYMEKGIDYVTAGWNQQSGLGSYATAEGVYTIASGYGSHAEGCSYASGTCAHAEGGYASARDDSYHGTMTAAIGNSSHAEGYGSEARGEGSHAEGGVTFAEGRWSHAEGFHTCAVGERSHAEGGLQFGENPHPTEGNGTVAVEELSHAEGHRTTAYGFASHSEGEFTRAKGIASHSEGYFTSVYRPDGHPSTGAHSEGYITIADGDGSHSEGKETRAVGIGAHSEGQWTTAYNDCAHVEGFLTYASGERSHAEGYQTKAYSVGSHAEGYQTSMSARSNDILNYQGVHMEGYKTSLVYGGGRGCHVEGDATRAWGIGSHAEGSETYADSSCAHAEGWATSVSGLHGHAEGTKTCIYNAQSAHTEGYETRIYNAPTHGRGCSGAHAEGYQTCILNYGSGDYHHDEYSAAGAHVEGYKTYARYVGAHAEGAGTSAMGRCSHAGGESTYATDYQMAIGTYNVKNTSYHFVIGGGSSGHEKDVFFVTSNGDVTCTSVNQTSSRTVKENIKDMTEEEANKLLQLRPVSFDYIEGEGDKNRFGLIAEEVQEIGLNYPVINGYKTTSNEECLALDYSRFVPYLIKVIQMQEERIAELENKLR